MKVSIVIANRNGEKYLEECLGAVERNTRVSYEVWVVDNASEDGSFREAKKKWEKRKGWNFVGLKRDMGPVAARNVGVRQARGEYVVFLDSDTEVRVGWLGEVVKYLDKSPKVGGGQLKLMRWDRKKVFDSAGDKITKWGFLSERAREAVDEGQFEGVEPIISGKMAAMVVRRKLLLAIGGLDETLWMYWEEPDLGWRVWKAGYTFMYLPMGVVEHKYGSSKKLVSEEWAKQVTYLGCRNQLAVIIKNGVGFSRWQMVFGVTVGWVGLALLMLFKLQFSRVGVVLRAFWWVLVNMGGIRGRREELKERLGSGFYLDNEWMGEVTVERGWQWYYGKGVNYVLGRPF